MAKATTIITMPATYVRTNNSAIDSTCVLPISIAGEVKSGNVYGARLKAVNENMDHKFVEERFWDDKMYLFPVPQEAMDNNGNLVQNEGW